MEYGLFQEYSKKSKTSHGGVNFNRVFKLSQEGHFSMQAAHQNSILFMVSKFYHHLSERTLPNLNRSFLATHIFTYMATKNFSSSSFCYFC